jgi:hypothetical protein
VHLFPCDVVDYFCCHSFGLEYAVSSAFWKKTALTLNLPMMTIVAQPFNVIKWQLKFNPVA